MRKLWYAGAMVASGFLLFAAAPAQADVQPGTTDAPAASHLLPGNSVAPPFGDLPGAGRFDQSPLLSDVLPGGRQQSFDSLNRPTAGDIENASAGMPLLGGAPPVNGLPTVPGGDLPDVTGFPGGGMAILAPAIADATDPAATDSATTPTDTAPAAAPPATPDKHKHKVKPSGTTTIAPSADPADPRLHEEPVDGEATRAFSPDRRPVAGVAQQDN